jgi:hypothetical protein
LFWEKSTAGWLLVAGLLREKYCWLVADKPSEQFFLGECLAEQMLKVQKVNRKGTKS